MPSLTLRILTPERIVLDRTVQSVRVPALDGSMGILPRHAAMVAALGTGELVYTTHDGRREVMFVSGGFAEVRDDTVRVVSQASEAPSEIDLERAAEAAERARERLRALGASRRDADLLRAEAALRRALLRERIARRYN